MRHKYDLTLEANSEIKENKNSSSSVKRGDCFQNQVLQQLNEITDKMNDLHKGEFDLSSKEALTMRKMNNLIDLQEKEQNPKPQLMVPHLAKLRDLHEVANEANEIIHSYRASFARLKNRNSSQNVPVTL